MKIPHHGNGSRTRGGALCFALLFDVLSHVRATSARF
jgi:hypothetical protein